MNGSSSATARPLAIAICEDQPEDMDRLADMIQRTLACESRSASIFRFSCGDGFLAHFQPDLFDIVFLDMYLDDALGIQLARTVRRTDPSCHIVFTTFSKEFALESYQVSAVHYLIKPVTEPDLREVWRRCKKSARADGAFITLMVDRKPKHIPLADVLYVEADNKLCHVHTPSEVLSTRISINQMELMLHDSRFCRCHRGYVVNFDHVESVGDDFIMKNGNIVYIRQTELAGIRSLYFKRLIEKTKG
jgi:DNA-binding LytR/AlgR family response regulator